MHMKEVLSLSYDASAASVVVKVASVKESEHVPGTFVRQLGAPEPQAHIRVDDLPAPHGAAFRALLAALPSLVEVKHAADVADPAALAAKAAAVAAQEQALATREKDAAEALAKAASDKSALDAEIATATARKAVLNAEIAAAEAAKKAAEGSP